MGATGRFRKEAPALIDRDLTVYPESGATKPTTGLA